MGEVTAVLIALAYFAVLMTLMWAAMWYVEIKNYSTAAAVVATSGYIVVGTGSAIGALALIFGMSR